MAPSRHGSVTSGHALRVGTSRVALPLSFSRKRCFLPRSRFVSAGSRAPGCRVAGAGLCRWAQTRPGSGRAVEIGLVLLFNVSFFFFLSGKKKSYFPRCSWVTELVCCALFPSFAVGACGGRHVNRVVSLTAWGCRCFNQLTAQASVQLPVWTLPRLDSSPFAPAQPCRTRQSVVVLGPLWPAGLLPVGPRVGGCGDDARSLGQGVERPRQARGSHLIGLRGTGVLRCPESSAFSRQAPAGVGALSSTLTLVSPGTLECSRRMCVYCLPFQVAARSLHERLSIREPALPHQPRLLSSCPCCLDGLSSELCLCHERSLAPD